MATEVLDRQVQTEYSQLGIISFNSDINGTNAKPSNIWMFLLEVIQEINIGRLLYYTVFKRWFDIIVTLFTIILVTPLLLLVAGAIWLESPGSIIFRQKRIGQYGRPFVIYKFRTMISDRRKADLSFVGEDRRKRHKMPNDPRVTRIGNLLRRTSIDELPQLWNIIRGDMSLVGPRPELPHLVRQYEEWQHLRHLVRPGLTGWWQVHGRSDLPMHEHTELDIYYVTNVSFWLDIWILLRTARIILLRSGAF